MAEQDFGMAAKRQWLKFPPAKHRVVNNLPVLV